MTPIRHKGAITGVLAVAVILLQAIQSAESWETALLAIVGVVAGVVTTQDSLHK